MEENSQQQPQQTMQGKQGQPEVDPAIKKQAEGYVLGLMKLVHGKETKAQVMGILESAEPDKSVPQAALVINDQMEKAVKAKGKVPFTVLGLGFQYLVEELLTMGESAGLFELTDETIVASFQNTIQKYIEIGFKNKTLDPVEVQAAVEPLLTDEQRQLGGQIGQKHNISQEIGPEQAMEAYAEQKVAGERAKNAEQVAQQKRRGAKGQQQGALQQAMQQQGGQR